VPEEPTGYAWEVRQLEDGNLQLLISSDGPVVLRPDQARDLSIALDPGNPFSEWLYLQWRLQVDSFATDPEKLTEEDRAPFVTWNAFAAIAELVEAMQEVGWKPWATSRHLNREAFLREIVDALHFIGNLALCAGGHPLELGNELWKLYEQKHEINAQRQRDGYDGVSEKCPHCDRELTTSSINRVVGRMIQPETVRVCEEHGIVEPKETSET